MPLLTSLLGNSQALDGGAMFGNAPRSLWSRWLTPDEDNRINLACRCLLVQDGKKNILLETGIGAFFDPKMKQRYGVIENEHVLLNSLAQKNLSDKDIDIIILSHLHFDHAGGLLSEWQENRHLELLFPNATYLVSTTAWERALNPHSRDRASFIPELIDLLIQSRRLQQIDGEYSSLLGDNFRFHFSDGHTPGMMLTEIGMSDGPVIFAADLIPGTAWVHLPITMGYDRFPELLIDEKQKLFQYLLKQNGRLFYTHDPSIALSNIKKNERGQFETFNRLQILDALAN